MFRDRDGRGIVVSRIRHQHLDTVVAEAEPVQREWCASDGLTRLRAPDACRSIDDLSACTRCPTRRAIDHVALGHRTQASAVVREYADRARAVIARNGTSQRFVGGAEIEFAQLAIRALKQELLFGAARDLRIHTTRPPADDRVT